MQVILVPAVLIPSLPQVPGCTVKPEASRPPASSKDQSGYGEWLAGKDRICLTVG